MAAAAKTPATPRTAALYHTRPRPPRTAAGSPTPAGIMAPAGKTQPPQESWRPQARLLPPFLKRGRTAPPGAGVHAGPRRRRPAELPLHPPARAIRLSRRLPVTRSSDHYSFKHPCLSFLGYDLTSSRVYAGSIPFPLVLSPITSPCPCRVYRGFIFPLCSLNNTPLFRPKHVLFRLFFGVLKFDTILDPPQKKRAGFAGVALQYNLTRSKAWPAFPLTNAHDRCIIKTVRGQGQ